MAKLKYEEPKLSVLVGSSSVGACIGTGTSAEGTCLLGTVATGNCNTNGNEANLDCMTTGNEAASVCSTGTVAVDGCNDGGNLH